MDVDARFLRALDYDNLDVREENVVGADLPTGRFDLIHTRWTLLHIPERERVLQRLVDCLSSGGTLFLEEPDAISVRTLDRTGFRTVSLRIFEIVQLRGSHPDWAQDLPFKMTSLGLGNVRVEGETPYFHGASELAEFWRISWGRVRDAVAQTGTDVTEWDRELAELDDPARLFVSPMTLAVIATKT
jgi:SAM-dependent methyltransferase